MAPVLRYMFDSHQKQLIKQAIAGQIEALKDLGHELTISPVAERKHLNLAAQELLNKLPNEINEYNKLRDLLEIAWPLDN